MLNYTRGKSSLTFELLGSGEFEEAQISICLDPTRQASLWLSQGCSVLSMVVEFRENTYAVLIPFVGLDDMNRKIKLANQIVPLYMSDLTHDVLIGDGQKCIIDDSALDYIAEDKLW